MRFACLSLFACGLFVIGLSSPGQAQTPAAPLVVPVPSSPTPTTPPAATLPPAKLPSTTLPPTNVETPLPGSGDGSAFAGDPDADPYKSVILDNADTFEQTTPGKWTGRGHVRVRYQGYLLTGDQVDVDTNLGIAVFSGNVHLVAPNGQTADAGPDGTLRVNLRRSTYTLTGARSVIQPEQTQLGLILPVYVYGGVVRGRPGLIDARGGEFTTCDFLRAALLVRGQGHLYHSRKAAGRPRCDVLPQGPSDLQHPLLGRAAGPAAGAADDVSDGRADAG